MQNFDLPKRPCFEQTVEQQIVCEATKLEKENFSFVGGAKTVSMVSPILSG